MAKKYKWSCGECDYKWKSNFKTEDLCPNCEGYVIFWKKRKKKEKAEQWFAPDNLLSALEKAYNSFVELASDKEVYEGSTCSCDRKNEACSNCPSDDDFEEEINQGHYFEIMDRVHIVQSNLDDFIRNHPAIDHINKEKVDETIELLSEVYNWASTKWDDWEDTTTIKVSG